MIAATADGSGVVSHAGSRALGDVADRTTLTGELSSAIACIQSRRLRGALTTPNRRTLRYPRAVCSGRRNFIFAYRRARL